MWGGFAACTQNAFMFTCRILPFRDIQLFSVIYLIFSFFNVHIFSRNITIEISIRVIHMHE